MTGLVGANPLVFYLNRADLLSWVDMGKSGSGFPGICHPHQSPFFFEYIPIASSVLALIRWSLSTCTYTLV